MVVLWDILEFIGRNIGKKIGWLWFILGLFAGVLVGNTTFGMTSWPGGLCVFLAIVAFVAICVFGYIQKRKR